MFSGALQFVCNLCISARSYLIEHSGKGFKWKIFHLNHFAAILQASVLSFLATNYFYYSFAQTRCHYYLRRTSSGINCRKTVGKSEHENVRVMKTNRRRVICTPHNMFSFLYKFFFGNLKPLKSFSEIVSNKSNRLSFVNPLWEKSGLNPTKLFSLC